MKLAISVASAVMVILSVVALFSPWLASGPYTDIHAVLGDAHLPPLSQASSGARIHWMGTDALGRDMLSRLLAGLRQSLWIGFAAVMIAALLGAGLGLLAGYRGGIADQAIMRFGELSVTIPPLLSAMVLFAAGKAWWGGLAGDGTRASWLIIMAIVLVDWVAYARAVRALVMIEKRKTYVEAAVAIGTGDLRIAFRHILPHASRPLVTLATLSVPSAIITEATLSFLGIGLPAGAPSLGTMIAEGQTDLFAGIWWTLAFPSGVLVALTLSISAIGYALQRGGDRRPEGRTF
ncbi:MAG: ABC transporter permease [Alphaproteobacteria bacterium]|nr:ABC transporter permease [Alphaproteobacteria bacterium]